MKVLLATVPPITPPVWHLGGAQVVQLAGIWEVLAGHWLTVGRQQAAP